MKLKKWVKLFLFVFMAFLCSFIIFVLFLKTTDKTNYTSNAKPGSMMAKANMVKEYNERNNGKD